MRATLLWLLVATMSFAYAQDSAVLKSVAPDYDKYSPDLATDFDIASTSVELTVQANGKPLAFNSVPLPMAVVMALKDYGFGPQAVPHGRPERASTNTYQVTLNLPIRQRKKTEKPQELGEFEGPYLFGPGVMKGMVVSRVRPVYPESARNDRIQGTVVFEALISKQGEVKDLKTAGGPFALIEAAYEAVRQWQYKPFLVAREPVEALGPIEVVFTLN